MFCFHYHLSETKLGIDVERLRLSDRHVCVGVEVVRDVVVSLYIVNPNPNLIGLECAN